MINLYIAIKNFINQSNYIRIMVGTRLRDLQGVHLLDGANWELTVDVASQVGPNRITALACRLDSVLVTPCMSVHMHPMHPCIACRSSRTLLTTWCLGLWAQVGR